MTDKQTANVGRVQLVGAVFVAVLTIGVPLLDTLHVWSGWSLWVVGALASCLTGAICVVLVARIEKIPVAELRQRIAANIPTDRLETLNELRSWLRRRRR